METRHTRHTYFLTLAEELNFTRAAARLFITQQALSDHIRRMEEQYGTLLFERRPKLKLTPAGETMVRRFRQMDIIENALLSELADYSEGICGHLSLGMNTARARILMPALVKKFRQLYPKVTMAVYHEETSNFEKMLLAGNLDLFMGVNVQPNPEFERICLMNEQTLLVVSRELLEKAFPDPALVEQWRSRGVDLRLFSSRIPIFLNPPVSRMRRQIDDFLRENRIELEPFLTIADNETQFLIAAQGVGACFTPQMMANYYAESISAAQPDNPLYTFCVTGLEGTASLELVYLKDSYQPRYVRTLIELLKKQTREYEMAD